MSREHDAVQSRIMGIRFCTLDKPLMAGNSHQGLMIDDTSLDFRGGSMAIQ